MAKDRFSNQKKENYQRHYIRPTPVVKRNLVFNREQKKYLKNFLSKYSSRLTQWEFEFINTLSASGTYSEKQRDTLKIICKKYLMFSEK
jgi:hypothetical protein